LDETPGCNEASLSARLAMMRGDINAATVYTSYLLDKGYLEPGFMRFCSQYELCESGEPK